MGYGAKKNREHLIGDLEGKYRAKVLPEYGRFWVRLWYWEQDEAQRLLHGEPTQQNASER